MSIKKAEDKAGRRGDIMKKKILAVALILMLCPCFATATELPHSMGLTGVGNARELGGYPAGDGRLHGVG